MTSQRPFSGDASVSSDDRSGFSAIIPLAIILLPQESVQRTPVLLAAAILLTSPKMIGMAQMARMDLMLCLLAFAAILSFARY